MYYDGNNAVENNESESVGDVVGTTIDKNGVHQERVVTIDDISVVPTSPINAFSVTRSMKEG